jgi:hypothetical protein
MLCHEGLNEIAFDAEFLPSRPHGVEGRARELRGNSSSAQIRWHLGIDKSDGAGRFVISDEGGFALDIEFEAMARLVVLKILSHAHFCFGAGAVKGLHLMPTTVASSFAGAVPTLTPRCMRSTDLTNTRRLIVAPLWSIGNTHA